MPAIVFDPAFLEPVSPERNKQIVAHIRDMHHVCTILHDGDNDSDESEVDELMDDSTAVAFDGILLGFLGSPARPENRYSAFVRLLRGYYPADDVAQASTVFIELPESHLIDTCCRQTLAIAPMENPFERLQAHEIIMDTRDALYAHNSSTPSSLLPSGAASTPCSRTSSSTPLTAPTIFRRRFDRVIEYRMKLRALFLKFGAGVLLDACCWFPPFSYAASLEDIPSTALLADFIRNAPVPDAQTLEYNTQPSLKPPANGLQAIIRYRDVEDIVAREPRGGGRSGSGRDSSALFGLFGPELVGRGFGRGAARIFGHPANAALGSSWGHEVDKSGPFKFPTGKLRQNPRLLKAVNSTISTIRSSMKYLKTSMSSIEFSVLITPRSGFNPQTWFTLFSALSSETAD
ncbi:unnamed protein product [Cyclocybe aegerita]|uniref:Uncharacterized protein n=1 Tax=Cyclocybe aegerita TaxID=1973307 RepID=A0A8S0VXL0_CYCAE|nr:unnamed protein product [Cyclocybe aegerita]